MWSKGTIEVDGTEISYEVKHFEEGSDFGIEGGRISKLLCKAKGEIILHYKRGWNIKPKTELTDKVYGERLLLRCRICRLRRGIIDIDLSFLCLIW